MLRLLHARTVRLFQDRVFQFLLLFMAAWALQRVFCVPAASLSPMDRLERWELYLCAYARPMGPLLAVFLGLHFGADCSGGAIRAPLIAGMSRFSLWLSAFLTGVLAAVTLILVYTAVLLAAGIPFLGVPAGLEHLPAHMLAVFCMCLSWCALFTAVCMLCPQPHISILLCLGLAGICHVVCSGACSSLLSHIDTPDQVPLARFLYDFLPMGEADQLRSLSSAPHLSSPSVLTRLALLFTGSTALLGLGLFQRRNIR